MEGIGGQANQPIGKATVTVDFDSEADSAPTTCDVAIVKGMEASTILIGLPGQRAYEAVYHLTRTQRSFSMGETTLWDSTRHPLPVVVVTVSSCHLRKRRKVATSAVYPAAPLRDRGPRGDSKGPLLTARSVKAGIAASLDREKLRIATAQAGAKTGEHSEKDDTDQMRLVGEHSEDDTGRALSSVTRGLLSERANKEMERKMGYRRSQKGKATPLRPPAMPAQPSKSLCEDGAQGSMTTSLRQHATLAWEAYLSANPVEADAKLELTDDAWNGPMQRFKGKVSWPTWRTLVHAVRRRPDDISGKHFLVLLNRRHAAWTDIVYSLVQTANSDTFGMAEDTSAEDTPAGDAGTARSSPSFPSKSAGRG